MLKTLSSNDCHFLTILNFIGSSVLLQGNALEVTVAKMLHYTSRMVLDMVRIKHQHRGKGYENNGIKS